MTFRVLFKRWCTTKSFCLMWSHFEKWQILRGCQLISSEHKYNRRHCAISLISLSIRGNTDVMWSSVGILLRRTVTFSSTLLSSPLNPAPKNLLRISMSSVDPQWMWPWCQPHNEWFLVASLNTWIKDVLYAGWLAILAMSASSQHTHYCFLMPSLVYCSCGIITTAVVFWTSQNRTVKTPW